MRKICLFLLTFFYSSLSFCNYEINLSHSSKILFKLNPSQSVHIILKNHSMPEEQKIWMYYCETMPHNKNIHFSNINVSSEYIKIIHDSKFEYNLTKQQINEHVIQFDVSNKGIFDENVSIMCWINGDFNVTTYDFLPKEKSRSKSETESNLSKSEPTKHNDSLDSIGRTRTQSAPASILENSVSDFTVIDDSKKSKGDEDKNNKIKIVISNNDSRCAVM